MKRSNKLNMYSMVQRWFKRYYTDNKSQGPRATQNPGINSGAPEGKVIPAPLVAPVVTIVIL
jgi:hypothetical protein